jgi:hypothetical protein
MPPGLGICWDQFAWIWDVRSLNRFERKGAPHTELLCNGHLIVTALIMPGKPFQSKLEPFYEFIRTCREKRCSYLRIAAAITAEHGMKVSANAVFSFVKVRSKGRKVFALEKQPQPKPQPSDAASEREAPAHEFFQQPTNTQTHDRKRYNLEF